ncbi:hypothetical protein CARUB_v10009373mg [Capsella rubella]|uniref:Uncharacterized protein n=1 Tax=Capsella rubella TaxID=81985 RepID=R0GQ40_9BRAS|nr:inactive GDSL esterase/lipase-like protein 25 [Capsella rubella]EOA37906.1 hypothetical protein CARUB_v10009373mg [Capsella rubella]
MANLKSHFLITTLLPLLLLHFTTFSFAQTLFVFGDGLYDAGNKQYLSQNRVNASFPPYGVTLGQATGRWSDGSIVPDYLANFMGIPHISPILQTTADFSHGANFATADATVLGSPPETMTLSQQVRQFSENKNKWINQTVSEAIYLFNIGSDDYLKYATNNPSPSDDMKQAFVDQVITTIEAEIKVVYGAGGRKFAFQNLAPLGCLPAVKQASGNLQECVSLPSEMAALHNKNLLQLLVELSRELSGFQYSYYDFFSSVQNRVFKSSTYTFKSGTAACCGTGSLNGTDCSVSNVCTITEEYIFFDGKHLTQAANLQVGHAMWGADPEVIGPNNLKELMVRPMDMTVILADIQEAMAAMRPRQSKIESLYDIKKMESEMQNHWLYQVTEAHSFMI